MKHPVLLMCFLLILIAGLAPFQSGSAAPTLSGFPFTDESLAYKISGPKGVVLGETHLTAKHGPAGWAFELKVEAGVPGFAIKDVYTSHTNADFCSTDFSRQFEHGSHKGREEETIDRSQESVTRTTIGGGGGKSEFPVSDCMKDALTMIYYTRREMGQGRVPPSQQILMGGLYDIRLKYAGAPAIQSGGSTLVTDEVICTVKGPASTFDFEMYFARDAARTPLLVKIPFPVGSISMELAR
jgi:hypothetical protein